MKDPKEEQWYFINITDIGPSSVSYFDVHDFDIYSIFVCVLYDSEINTNKQTNKQTVQRYNRIILIRMVVMPHTGMVDCQRCLSEN